jgi:hypothetical protein
MTADSDYQADTRHLRNLLSMLPRRDDVPGGEDEPFWKAVSDIEPFGFEDVSGALRPKVIAAMNTSPDAAYVVSQACLVLFDGEQPRLWQLVDKFAGYVGRVDYAAGRRWSEDVCTTAWRIFVHESARRRRSYG